MVSYAHTVMSNVRDVTHIMHLLASESILSRSCSCRTHFHATTG